jgi:hypothetical protein
VHGSHSLISHCIGGHFTARHFVSLALSQLAVDTHTSPSAATPAVMVLACVVVLAHVAALSGAETGAVRWSGATWDTLPVFIHSSNESGDWSDAGLAILAKASVRYFSFHYRPCLFSSFTRGGT